MKKYKLCTIKHYNGYIWPIILGEFSIKNNEFVEDWALSKISLIVGDKIIMIEENYNKNYYDCYMFFHIRSGKIILISNKIAEKII